jgi:murein DD-endopeptidase MepM/ murein hydrolase activator NlpD
MPIALPFDVAWIPVSGTMVLSRQGMRPSRHFYHPGLDLSGHLGDSIHPVAPGTVKRVCLWVPGSSCCGGYGNTVLIDHGNDFFSLYAHMSRVDVHEGDAVDRDTVLGAVGHAFSNFRDPACPQLSMIDHLHLEFRHEDGTRYDVLQILAAGGIGLDADARLVYTAPFDYAEPLLAVAKGNAEEQIVGPALRYGKWWTVAAPIATSAAIAALGVLVIAKTRTN